MRERIRKETEDRSFRKKVAELMGSAGEEIVFVAGEGSILVYPEVEESLRRLSEKGVRMRGCLSNPSRGVVEDLVLAGCDLYLGKAARNHFFVFDRKHWLSTPYHRPGDKGGVLHMDDPEGGERMVLLFESMAWNALFLSHLMREKERAEADRVYPPCAHLSPEDRALFMAELLPKVEESLDKNDWRGVKLFLGRWSRKCFWAFWETPVAGEESDAAGDLDEVVYAP